MVQVSAASGQDCSGGRYYDPIFPQVVRTNGVPYGGNIGVDGSWDTLLLDVYEPAGDMLDARPVVIVAFGGSFIAGSREDVELLCTEFARRGHVAIAPDYRIGGFPATAVGTMHAVMRGAHDLKACVRYLRSTVEEGDPWRIDPQRIVLGGVSAGSIAALHACYLNDDSEMPGSLIPFMEELGGVEGYSGHPGHSSEVLACYNFSGAIGDTAWIGSGDPPLASVHEVGDPLVPYYTEQVYVGVTPTGLVASGSHDIHVHLEQLGIEHCLLSYPGMGHLNYGLTDFLNSTQWVIDHIANVVCGTDAYCGMATVGMQETQDAARPLLWPDPAMDEITVDASFPGMLRITDMSGRIVMRVHVQEGARRIDVSSLPAGTYLVSSDAWPGAFGRFIKL